jgi:flagellar hook-associated protein FlgK
MLSFSIGTSALQANQTALTVVGNNIANANTPGYHKRDALLVENPNIVLGDLRLGTGVRVDSIRRARDGALENSLTHTIADSAGAAAQLDSARRMESLLLPGTGSLLDRLTSFLDSVEALSAYPQDAAMRTTTIRNAEALAHEVNRVSRQVDTMQADLTQSVRERLAAANALIAQITAVNREAGDAIARGEGGEDFLDRRDALVNALAEYVDVDRQRLPDGQERLVIGGFLLLGRDAFELEVGYDESNNLAVYKPGCDRPLDLHGGSVGGAVAAAGGGLNGYVAQLQELVSGLVQGIDSAHATGVGPAGSFQSLMGTRRVADVDVPLATAGTIAPIGSGTLFLSLTDQSSGARTLQQLAIDAEVDTLRDVADRMNLIPHLSAQVDEAGGRLLLASEAGYTFDFTGGLPTLPTTSAITGSTTPTISGLYGPAGNEEVRFTFQGSGTIGVTESLKLEVRDSGGRLINILEVGSSYEPQQRLLVGDGIELRLTSGTVGDGDTFTVRAIGNPDDTNFLAALGMNTLFAGDSLETFSLNQDILHNSALLATSKTGAPSDTTNLVRMAAIRDEPFLANGTLTLEAFGNALIAHVGADVSTLEQIGENADELRGSLEGEIGAVSGVDVNEEMVKMLKFQRAFQAASRYIVTIDELLADLFSIVR